jgi:DNA-binding NtrC family response regulator
MKQQDVRQSAGPQTARSTADSSGFLLMARKIPIHASPFPHVRADSRISRPQPTGMIVASSRVNATRVHVFEERHVTQNDSVKTEKAGTTPISLDDRLREVEAELITWALTLTRGNKSKAAKLLQIKRSTLGDRINRCGVGRLDRSTAAAMPRHGSAVSEGAPHDCPEEHPRCD